MIGMGDLDKARIAGPGQSVRGVIEDLMGHEIKDLRPQVPEGKCTDCGGNCSPRHAEHPRGCVLWGIVPIQQHWHPVDGCPLRHGDPCNCKKLLER